MAEKPVCAVMNGAPKLDIQGSVVGPKQHKLSSAESTRIADLKTNKTLTEINQEDASVSEPESVVSEVLRIQNGRLVCENTTTTADNAVELQLATQVSESESQVFDFSKQNIDATVNISIDPSLLESANTSIIPLIESEQSGSRSTFVRTVVCEDSEAAIANRANPEVTGTSGTDSGVVELHNVTEPESTAVLETSNDVVSFQIVTDETEIREGEAVNVINIPDTGDNVSAGFALVSDLISSEDLVTMTTDPAVAVPTTTATMVAPVDTLKQSNATSSQIISQVVDANSNSNETSNAIQILNTTQASEIPMVEAVTPSVEPQDQSQVKIVPDGNPVPVTEIDLGTACTASGAMQLNVSSLTENLPTNAQPGQQIVYMVTSRDKTTGLMTRFRVTVDPESVTHLPIGAINLGGTLPGLGLGAGNQIITGDQVVTDVGGNLLTTSGGVGNVVSSSAHDTIPVTLANSIIKKSSGSAPVTYTVPSSQTKVLNCPEEGCTATFSQRNKLKLHQHTHANDRPFKCEQEGCEWAFQTLYKLRRHEGSHTGLKPYMCGHEECSKTFSTIYNLNIHMKLHKQMEYVACEVEGCGEVFSSKKKLEIHQRKHFEDKQIKCTFPGCGKSFTTSSAFGSHQRIHQREEQMFACPVEGCDKIYDKACRLKLHMRSHTGERPYKCTFEGCQWAFTCQQKLSRHMVRHTGDRKYQCKFEGCNKLFTRLEHLKGHLVSHSGEKPYACNEPDCNARFSSRSSLYMHVKRHKAGKPMREKLLFSCPFDTCNKSYNTKLGLKNHMVKEHNIQLSASVSSAETESPTLMDMDQMVYIPAEQINIALKQFADIGGGVATLATGGASEAVFHIKPQEGVGPGGDANILQQAADAAEKTMEANLLTPVTSPPLVTTGGLINDVPAGFTTPANLTTPAQDTAASLQTSLAGACKVHQERHSGSARTDYIHQIGGIKKPQSMDDFDSDQSDNGVMICASYPSTPNILNNSSGNGSASLIMRDPVTGARYMASQLLQDDPPDENDMVFSLTPPPSTANQSTLGSDLPVTAILPGGDNPSEHQTNPTDFLQTESTGSEMEGFRESTINLQDLE